MSINYRKNKQRRVGGSTATATIVLVAFLCGALVLFPETETALEDAMSYLRIN